MACRRLPPPLLRRPLLHLLACCSYSAAWWHQHGAGCCRGGLPPWGCWVRGGSRLHRQRRQHTTSSIAATSYELLRRGRRLHQLRRGMLQGRTCAVALEHRVCFLGQAASLVLALLMSMLCSACFACCVRFHPPVMPSRSSRPAARKHCCSAALTSNSDTPPSPCRELQRGGH